MCLAVRRRDVKNAPSAPATTLATPTTSDPPTPVQLSPDSGVCYYLDELSLMMNCLEMTLGQIQNLESIIIII